jgi:hypothetical protein
MYLISLDYFSYLVDIQGEIEIHPNIKTLGSFGHLWKSHAFSFALYFHMRTEMPCRVLSTKVQYATDITLIIKSIPENLYILN